MDFKQRWQEKEISSSLKSMRVTMLTGARQCGKTTLARHIVSGGGEYRTLDDTDLRLNAESSPRDFIKHNKTTMVIDEIQKVPELLNAVKMAVDENNRLGQYLITGSADIHNLADVDSMAGRIGYVRLRPFTYGEILGKRPCFFERLRNRDFTNNRRYHKGKVLEAAFRGGFPEVLRAADQGAIKRWHRNYAETLIRKDLRDLTNIRRQDKLRDLLRIVSVFSAKYMNKAGVIDRLDMAKRTLDEYLNILERAYLIDTLPAWTKSDYKYTARQHKMFVCDTGLMSSLLNWKIDDVSLDNDKLGKIIETFVYHQLIVQIELDGDESALYHYREWAGDHEIDFLIENSKEITGIEVKSGSAVGGASKHLAWFQDKMAGRKKFLGLVLHTGEHVLTLDKNIYAVPVNNLWE
jgi:predicted AAA+ superfamily ATPase